MSDQRDPFEEELRAAYGRLGEVDGPGDAAARVRARITQRRRRAAAVAAAVVVVAGGASWAVAGGGSDRAIEPADDGPGPPAAALVTERADGSAYELDDGSLACRGRGPDAVVEWRSAPEPAPEVDRLEEPLATIIVPVTRSGTEVALGAGSADDVTLFVAQDEQGGRRGNEASSAESGTAGSLEVLEATCDPEPRLHLRVDTELGSELGDRPTIPLRGTLGQPAGADAGPTQPEPGATEELPAGLVVELDDGSREWFAGTALPCGFLGEPGTLTTMLTPGGATGGDGAVPDGPTLAIDVVVDGVEAGRTYDLPLDAGSGDPLSLFYAHYRTPERPRIEAGSANGSGTVEVLEATCAPEPHLALRVDALLPSELGGGPVRVRGEVSVDGP